MHFKFQNLLFLAKVLVFCGKIKKVLYPFKADKLITDYPLSYQPGVGNVCETDTYTSQWYPSRPTVPHSLKSYPLASTATDLSPSELQNQCYFLNQITQTETNLQFVRNICQRFALVICKFCYIFWLLGGRSAVFFQWLLLGRHSAVPFPSPCCEGNLWNGI